MSEQTGLEAKTIHRLLETDPKTGGFRRDASVLSIAICWSSTKPVWSTRR